MSDHKGEFSHVFYDDMTEMVFVYFNEATVQDLQGKQFSGGFSNEEKFKEFCVWLKPEQYAKMRDYFIDHPTLDSIE